MNKICTSIEQSKKLMELGIDVNTADMYYEEVCNLPKAIIGNYILHNQCMEDKDYKKLSNPVLSPAWSLSALLEVLPLGLYDECDNCDYELEIDMIDKMPRYIRLGDIYHSQFPYDFEKATLLDNIVESIIWLNDNNYFEL